MKSLPETKSDLSRDALSEWRVRSSAAPPGQPPDSPETPLRNGTVKKRLYGEYHTGFNMGDAIYRDTHLPDPFCHNHWHAGIFQVFEFFDANAGFEGCMRGVLMTGWPGAVVPFAASSNPPANPQWDFADPQCDVAAAMHRLYESFLEAFKVDADHPFHGARQTPTMSKVDRLNLPRPSEELTYRTITYTFADMLDWHGAHWSGDIDAIHQLRCDGVVEYAYEANGKKVCAGTEVANWNIAAPGNQHPESHADLHTWGLNQGEL